MKDLDYEYLSELVIQARLGNSDAFAELYLATCQQQYRFAYKYLRDEFLAQDAMQETYILALKNIGALRNPKVFVSWLNQINMRVCFDMYHKQQVQSQGMERYAENYLNSDTSEDNHASPEDRTIWVDEKQYIINQVMSLPCPESQAIILRYYRNMKIEEIADAMQVSVSTAKRYIRSGKNLLSRTIDRKELGAFRKYAKG